MAATVASTLFVGCDDPFGVDATREVATDTAFVYAMTGTPPSFPSGYSVSSGFVSRIESAMTFDVAFDLTPTRQVRLIPARLVSPARISLGLASATQQVGMQVSSTPFDAITRAPSTGYKRDSVVVADPGQAVLLEVISDICQFQVTFSSVVYAKLVVDSVNTVSRQIFFRAVRDPNCGFRSFQPGIPRN